MIRWTWPLAGNGFFKSPRVDNTKGRWVRYEDAAAAVKQAEETYYQRYIDALQELSYASERENYLNAAVAVAEQRGRTQARHEALLEFVNSNYDKGYEQGQRDALTPEVFDKWVNGEVAKAVADDRERIRKAVVDLFSDQTWFLLPDKVQRDLLAVIDGGTE
jgi:flagellar biosynthesis/type III secretory pathway protein FliH